MQSMPKIMPGTLMQDHFSHLASSYNELRTTDPSPVEYIRETLAAHQVTRCADVGCGGGRYDPLLFSAMPGMHLTCCDINQAMLDETDRYLKLQGLSRYSLQLIDAEMFTVSENKFDCIVSFNAIHHFDPIAFLKGAGNALRPGGQIFLYTRLHEQNKETIWGRFFPDFIEKEHRLYRMEQIEQWRYGLDTLKLQHIELFCYTRKASLQHLVDLACNRHYSTFEFYTDKELHDAIDVFRRRIHRNFEDSTNIEWIDANVMIVLQSTPKRRNHSPTKYAGR